MSSTKSLALIYLARGADERHLEKFRRFVHSYRTFGAGVDHQLFVIFKGFDDAAHLREGVAAFASLTFQPIHTDDLSFDLGAYVDAARQVESDRVCFLNTNSEIASHHWLAKLSNNLDLPRVGIVGATASFESFKARDSRFPDFPNLHVRSNAFMLERGRFLEVASNHRIGSKSDAYLAESGPESLTRRIFAMGLSALLVGADGRAHSACHWPKSFTFRQGSQSNLLVKDNATRIFDESTWGAKKRLSARAWGQYIDNGALELRPGSEF
jgi:hypothetical protein